jgi:hypothetical protein
MNAPGSAALAEQIDAWEVDEDGNRHIVESALPIATTAVDLVHWLEVTGKMVADTLNLARGRPGQSYRHTWNGDVYDVSRQWTIWRILSHDIHHGGQIALDAGHAGHRGV